MDFTYTHHLKQVNDFITYSRLSNCFFRSMSIIVAAITESDPTTLEERDELPPEGER